VWRPLALVGQTLEPNQLLGLDPVLLPIQVLPLFPGLLLPLGLLPLTASTIRKTQLQSGHLVDSGKP